MISKIGGEKEMEENKKDRRKTGLLLSILGVISLVLITAGVTYAFFSYAKEGQTENVITTGTITFAYNETEANGSGILLEDALPLTDTAGKALDGEHKVFHFTVASRTPSTAEIPYVVTVKKDATSTLSDSQVKIYLTATNHNTSADLGNGYTVATGDVVNTFDQLPLKSTFVGGDYEGLVGDLDNSVERVIFADKVAASSNTYNTDFALRMWLSGNTAATTADYSPFEFMAKTAVVDNNAIDAEAKITSNDFITSTEYYALSDVKTCSNTTYTTESDCTTNGGTWASPRDAYERIAYVNTTDKTVLTRSQAIALNYASLDSFGNFEYSATNGTVANFAQTEQYYQINGQSYKITVNVYAQGAKVTH